MSLWKHLEGPELSDDVREEISFYLEMRAAEFEASGLDSAEARREAVRAFGDPDRIRKRVVREAKMKKWMTKAWEILASVAQDLRVASRSYRREPVFTLVAVTTLALGIGASKAIFSVTSQALLARPAVEDADGLAAVYTTCRSGTARCSSSYPDYLDYRDGTEGIADLAATALISASLGSEDQGARLLTAQTVTGNFFDVLGLAPAHGRLFGPADDETGGGSPVVVLSHELWRTHFAADPGVVGSSIRLNGQAFEVVGVTPRDFDGLRIDTKPQLWVPIQSRPYLTGGDDEYTDRFEVRDMRWIDLLVARLTDGTSVDVARSELLALSESMRDEDPDARGPRSVTVDALEGYILPNQREADFRIFVHLLGGTVALALLLCCANLANLLLARGSSRRRDVGVRLAIGAGRPRIVRQLVTESFVLAALGGLAGLIVAEGLMRVLGGFELPGGVPIASLGVSLDTGALLLAGLVTLGTAVLFGLAPALDGSRTELSGALRSGRGARDDLGSTRARKALVAVQIALSLVLLVGSALFVRTLRAGLQTDLGFRPEGVAALRYNLDLVGYEADNAWSFVQTLEERLASVPGVESVTTATRIPLQEGGAMGLFFQVPGYEPAPDEELRLDLVVTTPGYPRTMGVDLLSGRDFDSGDVAGGERVAIVSRSMAERYWPRDRAVGALVSMSRTEFRVVGVVENTTWSGLADEATSFMYVPLSQTPFRREHDGGHGRRRTPAPAHGRDSPVRLRPAGAGAVGRGDRGRGRLHDQPAAARHRGARGVGRERRLDSVAPGLIDGSAGPGPGRRHGCGGRPHAPRRGAPLSGERDRPGDVRRDRADGGRDLARGDARPGELGRAAGPCGGPEQRMRSRSRRPGRTGGPAVLARRRVGRVHVGPWRPGRREAPERRSSAGRRPVGHPGGAGPRPSASPTPSGKMRWRIGR